MTERQKEEAWRRELRITYSRPWTVGWYDAIVDRAWPGAKLMICQSHDRSGALVHLHVGIGLAAWMPGVAHRVANDIRASMGMAPPHPFGATWRVSVARRCS